MERTLEERLATQMTHADKYEAARELFFSGKKREAAVLATELSDSGCAPAHMLLGLIYEFGGDGYEIDLSKAIGQFRKAAYMIRSSVPNVHLARVLMKEGGGANFGLAERCLATALELEPTADVFLACAALYERCEKPNYDKAGRYYRIAALHGRLLALRRYAALLDRTSRPIAACSARLVLAVVGPFAYLLLGKRALKDF